MDNFRVLLNCVDHYQATPTEFDPPLFPNIASSQLKNAPHVPVIRVFGATETGQKVCAHIHGALPYLYIEYQGSLDPEAVQHYIQQLRASIDHALAVSYRRNVYDGKAVFVAHITLIKGVPFFGYHVGYRYFLKIYMLNPLNMTRFADLLHQGAIMNTFLQPFEAHAQYLQQWMGDYNLHGCNYINCKTVKFRSPLPEFSSINNRKHKWHDRSIHAESLSNPDRYPRQSHCSIEVDVCVQDILNRLDIEMRDQHATFMERFSPQTAEDKLVPSLSGLWRDETRRRKIRMGLTDPSSSPFPPEVLVSMSADIRKNEKGGWIHEDEFREMIDKLVKNETPKDGQTDVQFEEFVQTRPEDGSIKTAFESVDDLFPENLLRFGSTYAVNSLAVNGIDREETAEVLVDENSIPKFDDDDFLYGSDEEIAKEIALTQMKDKEVGMAPMGGVPEQPEDSATPEYRASLQNVTDLPRKDVDEMTSRELWRQERYGNPQAMHRDLTPEDQTTFQSNGSALEQSSDSGGKDSSTPYLSNKQEDNDLASARENKKRKLFHRAQRDRNHEYELPTDQNLNSQGERDRPRSRHVRFQDAEGPNAQVDSKSTQEQQHRSSGTPSSSQLSQGSIKATGTNEKPSLGFNVSKSPHSSQQNNAKESPHEQSLRSQTYHTTHNSKTQSPNTPRSNDKASLATTSPFSETSETPHKLVELITKTRADFLTAKDSYMLIFAQTPPRKEFITATIPEFGLPPVIYQDAHYSAESDVPERARDYAGREFRLESITVPFLPEFDPTGSSPAAFGAKQPALIDKATEALKYRRKQRRCHLRNWELAERPPLRSEVVTWVDLQSKQAKASKPRPGTMTWSHNRAKQQRVLSQIDGPTQRNLHGFKFSQRQESTSVKHETQYMSTMSLEVHVNTRDKLAPNPEEDEVACVFWCLQSDDEDIDTNGHLKGTRIGIVALAEQATFAAKVRKEIEFDVDTEATELDLLNRIVDIVRDLDPDILTGYEVHNGSWGYLIERARVKYDFNLCDEFSRMMSQSHGRFGKESDRWGFNHTSTIRVTGRHMINIWRAMRGELNLLQYTLENVAFNLLHKRVPHYCFRDLTTWYKSDCPRNLSKCLRYWLSRVQTDLDILNANELIPRTSEQARLIGIDFFSVFSRGSQFKVESFMFRIAKPENFILVSPSRKQVGQQNALECLPLVMEPQSDFYNSPLLVLDFQSLYPSIMIAYNYCYSTCLGRIVGWRGQNKMGFADFKRQPGLLELVKDKINISPNGMMYVRPEMRKSLLAKMLGEILETRIMVKSGMKADKDDKTLQQLLNNRQLALKLLANVTYGYTSASFSGRMPCAEIADSIVQTARETLEKAIALIHSVPEWGAEVVYGDTDSLFVYLKGRTKEQAFSIGSKIAAAITDANPRPVKLKFEKVYHPCVLLAKKRYVGFKYESLDQQTPDFDAKGIETVRRDGTPAEQKIEETALKILFRTADLSQVKDYFQRQCTKIMRGKVSIQDFCFAREVKLGTYADKGPPPPGALISTKRMLADPRLEPQYGERVPYVVVTGAPGARLIDRCVAPEQLLNDEGSELDAEYYISKNLIPPLERIFNLVGANVRQWYDEMPKVQRIRDVPGILQNTAAGANSMVPHAHKKTLESYMQSSHCIVCRAKLEPSQNDQSLVLPLCSTCFADPPMSLYRLRSRQRATQRKASQLSTICRSCAGLAFGDEVRCDSKDCPVFYSRVRADAEETRVRRVVDGIGKALEESEVEW